MSDSPLAANPYEVLGVSPTASDDELKRAYRVRLRHAHPDTGGSAAEFDRVQQAWQRVGTPAARRAYDLGADTGSPGATWAQFPQRWWHAARRHTPERAGARPPGRLVIAEQFLDLMNEWIGRGEGDVDPFDAQFGAPRAA